ncbi:PP2C family protein-serine/threonine phosphatase [Asanoa sp. WMMD1127]|uniref:PP2C family protein-serine/threonine phosphatase n=1 Tax=Asanoa sp. WMMD1127 TaxID=3016107 RepID=UPI002416A182|nr:PP2C family protein-serine/threonine phosphatase [Asanoa sp. WMMD1127]MDG4821996.1 PP2C family protein-serine/threonine phosphatase [Asanoa sp. WMMD1127]
MSTADLAGSESGGRQVPATAAPGRSAVAPSAPRRISPVLTETTLVDHFREGVVVTDPTGVVREFSQPALELMPGLAVGRTLAGCGIAPLEPGELTIGERRVRCRRVDLTVGGATSIAWYVEDVTDAIARSDALLAERGRARFLATASQKLGNPLHEDRAARAAVRLAVPTLGEVAVVVLAPRRGRARWWRAAGGDAEGPALVDGGVLNADDLPPGVEDALRGTEPSEADWLAEQLAEAGWLGDRDPGTVAVRVVPLPGSSAATGALVVVRSADLDEHDMQMLRGFAARAGAALDAAVLYRDQAEVAETLQASLAPTEPPSVGGVQWGAAYRPAQSSLRIGGDFYGAHELPDGGALFYLGDVSGKGVDAAVFTGQIRQGLQALRRIESDPARLLTLLNDSVLETTRAHGHGRFATMVLGRANPVHGGGLSLTLASGGHLPPIVVRADGAVETVDLRGMLIGVVPDPRIASITVQLAAGETCLLFSDGVTEARGGIRGEQFGAARLVDALGGCQRMPAPALAERVEQVIGDWLGGRNHDDIAVFAVRAVSPGSPARHLHAVPDRRSAS